MLFAIVMLFVFAGFAGNNDIECVVLEGFAEDGTHVRVTVIFFDLTHNGGTASEGKVVYGNCWADVIS